MVSQRSIYPPPTDSFADVGTLPTWEKGTHQPSQTTGLAIQGMVANYHSSMLLNQTSGILPLLFEPTQGCQKMLPFSGMLDGLVCSPNS